MARPRTGGKAFPCENAARRFFLAGSMAMELMMSPKLFTSQEVSQLLGVKQNTLSIWRLQGRGPAFRKVGRLVRYVEADVAAWLDAQRRDNTSQVPNGGIRR
jgi:predicted DNA-binding transcriptional regulator AlpA